MAEGLNDYMAGLAADAAATGAAVFFLKPVLDTAPLPAPFRVPPDSAWGFVRRDPSDAETEEDYSPENEPEDEMDEEVEESEQETARAASGGEKSTDTKTKIDKPVVSASPGANVDLGRMRCTAIFLVHGDPAIHRLTAQALKWSAKHSQSAVEVGR